MHFITNEVIFSILFYFYFSDIRATPQTVKYPWRTLFFRSRNKHVDKSSFHKEHFRSDQVEACCNWVARLRNEIGNGRKVGARCFGRRGRRRGRKERRKKKKLVSTQAVHCTMAREWNGVEKGIDRGPPRFYDRPTTDKYRSFICR